MLDNSLVSLLSDQVLVIIDVKPKDLGLPTEAYISVEEIHDVSTVDHRSYWNRFYQICSSKHHIYFKLIIVLAINLDPKNHAFVVFQDGTPTSKTFEHVTSEIGAEEAEEVGVEHLLRYWTVV